MSSFEVFLKELAPLLHFPSLAPDSSGACLIIIKDGEIPLLFEFDDHLVPNTILVSTYIAPIPKEQRALFYAASLNGNCLIEETLSVKPDEEALYLHRRFHPDIQSPHLDQVFQGFLKQAKEWKAKAGLLAKEQPSSMNIPSGIQVFPKA